MRITLQKSPEVLAELKLAAQVKVDREAEGVRHLFITPGEGQMATYQQKALEAEMVAANPEIDPALVPHIAAEAQVELISLLEAAQVVLTMRQLWTMASAAIDGRRLAAKKAVREAISPVEVEAAANVDWSDISALLSGP